MPRYFEKETKPTCHRYKHWSWIYRPKIGVQRASEKRSPHNLFHSDRYQSVLSRLSPLIFGNFKNQKINAFHALTVYVKNDEEGFYCNWFFSIHYPQY